MNFNPTNNVNFGAYITHGSSQVLGDYEKDWRIRHQFLGELVRHTDSNNIILSITPPHPESVAPQGGKEGTVVLTFDTFERAPASQRKRFEASLTGDEDCLKNRSSGAINIKSTDLLTKLNEIKDLLTKAQQGLLCESPRVFDLT